MHNTDNFRRRRLPHWDVPGAGYFVTVCLHGSIPAQGLLEIGNYRESLERRPRPADLSENEWQIRKWKLAFARSEQWLDRHAAARQLGDPRLAATVVDSLYYFAGVRYDLLAFVVMPSHFHWLFRPLGARVATLGPSVNSRPPRERVMHSIKRYTARACNRLLGRDGTFWQDESYDHCLFDTEEVSRVNAYIEQNPVKAGLVTSPEEWPFSSAKDRIIRGISPGQPLFRSVEIQST